MFSHGVHDLANKIAVNLEQALHNLVLNATQNAPEGSRIRLKFYYDNNLLTIQVMDR